MATSGYTYPYQCEDVWREADKNPVYAGKKWFTRREIEVLLPGISKENLDQLDNDRDGKNCERP